MQRSKIYRKFMFWRLKQKNHKFFILTLSIVVGIFSGLAAVILKNAIHYTTYFLFHGFSIEHINYLYFIYPIIGIFLTVFFVKYILKDSIGHGVSKILYAISRGRSKIKSHNNWSSMLASTLTIAFGGSVGSEAPIVLTGASIGSNLGRFFHVDYKILTLLVACGAGGGIAGIFKAPIAGLVFTLEVLMLDLTMASLVPLLISCVSATMVAYFLMGRGAALYNAVTDPFVLNNIPYYLLLGVISGFVSLYFTKVSMYVEAIFDKYNNSFKKIILGGILLSILILIFPSLYGEGYETLRCILSGNYSILFENSLFSSIQNNYWIVLLYALFILIFKVIAMSITNGSGGVGGVFAPTLFVGGITGFIVAHSFNILPFVNISETNFALVGMGGLMAGVMHAPLTGIFLIAEITGGYSLLLPLIITSTISYITIMMFEPYSIYTKRLAIRGELLTHDKDKVALSLLKVTQMIEKDFSTIDIDATLGDLVKVISTSKRNVFPVIDDNNNFYGVVFINDIRNIVFKKEIYDTTFIKDLMFMPATIVSPDEPMKDVVKKFNDTGNYNLPVIKDGKYIGFVSRAKVFSSYRKLIKDFSDE